MNCVFLFCAIAVASAATTCVQGRCVQVVAYIILASVPRESQTAINSVCELLGKQNDALRFEPHWRNNKLSDERRLSFRFPRMSNVVCLVHIQPKQLLLGVMSKAM